MTRLMRVAAVVTLFTCVLFLTSCTSIERPSVMLDGMEVDGISTEGIELRLNLKIENPNPFAAVVSDFAYTVEVDGIEIAGGGQPGDVKIPAQGSVDVEIPSRLEWSGTRDVLKRLTVSGEHDWKISGDLKLKKGFLSRHFDFNEKGTFDGSLDVEIDL